MVSLPKTCDMQATIHRIALVLRKIDEIVSSPKFSLLYDKASDAEKQTVISIINRHDVDELRNWMAKGGDLESKTLAELRLIAKSLHINTRGLSKAVVVYLIEEEQRARENQRTSSEDEEVDSQSRDQREGL